MTGSATASDEFVELFNNSAAAVDISGWQIRFVNASSTSGSTTLALTVAATTVLPAYSYYVLHTDSVTPSAGVMHQPYGATGKLSNTDKTIGLYKVDRSACMATVQDAIAWGAGNKGEGPALAVASADTGKEKLVQRFWQGPGYLDSDNNLANASLTAATASKTTPPFSSLATPGAQNGVGGQLTSGSVSSLAPVNVSGCVLPSTAPASTSGGSPSPTTPSSSPPSSVSKKSSVSASSGPSLTADSNNGLIAPQLSELLPNPAPPAKDADAEFIELYNPNSSAFDLSGYKLESGLASKRRYTFKEGTQLPGKSFVAFFAADTHLALANGGGQVSLLDADGELVVGSDPYEAAADGQAWLFANNTWQWTTNPTPGAINNVASVAGASTAAKNSKDAKKSAPAKGRQASGQTTTSQKNAPMSTASSSPLHPGVLALVASFALLYGAYEYRSDLANKIRQFRNYRAARKAAGQESKGR